MLLPLRCLSSHLRRAVSASALLPLRRLPGHLHRSLSTATSPPPWAMICRVSVTRGPSFSLAPPPSATLFSLPERAFNLEGRSGGGYVDHYGSIVFAWSGDGLLLLKATRHRFSAHTNVTSPREVLVKELVEEEHLIYVCNPVSGQLVRLPPSWGTTSLTTATGLLTQADRGRGPPKRYAAAELIELKDVGHFALCRFCSQSQTGKWDIKERLSPLPPGRLMRMRNHEVLAFAGRLRWVDVSWGAVSTDPFKEERQLGHVKLPEGSELPDQDANESLELTKHRRMGVSNGRLLYVEVSEEEPFQIKSFILDGESGPWTLQHQMSLDTLWPNGGNATKERPLNTDLLYLNMGGEEIVSFDLRRNRVVDAYSVLSSGISANMFLPCVLPSFLGSTLIPGKRETIADTLVRLDRCKKK